MRGGRRKPPCPRGRRVHPKLLGGALLLAALLLAAAAPGQDLVVYPLDASDFIHPNKWKARESGAVLDARRVSIGEALSLMSRSATADPSEYGISLVDAESTTLEATLTVHRASVAGPGGRGEVWLSMTAFHSDGWGTPGDATGDVRAFISLARRPEQPGTDAALDVRYHVVTCPDDACHWTAAHRTGDFGAGIKAQLRIPVRLQIRWEPATRRFLFTKDDTTVPVSYSLPEGYAPGRPEEFVTLASRGIGTRMDVSIANVKVSRRRLLSDKTTYALGEGVFVSYSGMPQWDDSRIDIERVGMAGAVQSRGTSYGGVHGPGLGAGSAYFPGVSGGTYVARYYDSSGTMLMESTPFTVAAGPPGR